MMLPLSKKMIEAPSYSFPMVWKHMHRQDIKKDDGPTAVNEETLTFKVIEFNRDDKKIIVSHKIP